MGAKVREKMVLQQSFSLTVDNPKDVGTQTVCIEYFGGSLSDPKQVDPDQCKYFLSFA